MNVPTNDTPAPAVEFWAGAKPCDEHECVCMQMIHTLCRRGDGSIAALWDSKDSVQGAIETQGGMAGHNFAALVEAVGPTTFTSSSYYDHIGDFFLIKPLQDLATAVFVYALSHGSGVVAWCLKSRLLATCGQLIWPVYVLHVTIRAWVGRSPYAAPVDGDVGGLVATFVACYVLQRCWDMIVSCRFAPCCSSGGGGGGNSNSPRATFNRQGEYAAARGQRRGEGGGVLAKQARASKGREGKQALCLPHPRPRPRPLLRPAAPA